MPKLNIRDERGAVAVIVALVIVTLIGVTALAVEGSQMWADKGSTQDTADSAALAVAAACASSSCDDPASVAADYVPSDGSQQITATVDGTTATTTATIHNKYLFGAVIGSPSGTVESTATATWAPLTSATTAPFAVTTCAWQHRSTGDVETLKHGASSNCSDGELLYLAADTCDLHTQVGERVTVQADTTCDLSGYDSGAMLIPVVNPESDTVEGVAAVRVDGWCLAASTANMQGWCTADDQQVRAQFVDTVALQAGTISQKQPSYGAVGVNLA